MAIGGSNETLEVCRFPQSKYVDAVRWLPKISALERFAVVALSDFDSGASSIDVLALDRSELSTPSLQSSWTAPSRVSSLRTSESFRGPVIAASTLAGSVHFLFANSADASLESEVCVSDKAFHAGAVSCVDLKDGGSECLSVGEDGRINLVNVGDTAKVSYRRVFDSNGLVSYTAAKWASPVEFATGGLGFSLQWWDQRKPGGAACQLKGDWFKGASSGMVHSVDIHSSRKDICLAGGSSGVVFAWDLRRPQQSIILSQSELNENESHLPCESEVWSVQYDSYFPSSRAMATPSAHILPAMICSEDGILAVIRQGEEPVELLAETCAINSFDIDKQNPSDVICGLEWESIAILSRP
uniref:Nuclear pore complex protein NUP43 n=1 Tax=Kalanchoe fedtschenkoi TaxID=63787 RepID=A0A7N0SWK5_KALFE